MYAWIAIALGATNAYFLVAILLCVLPELQKKSIVLLIASNLSGFVDDLMSFNKQCQLNNVL